jgi:RNA polymerase sigma factor (sigma-70 family)
MVDVLGIYTKDTFRGPSYLSNPVYQDFIPINHLPYIYEDSNITKQGQKFESLDSYLRMAEKIINKHSNLGDVSFANSDDIISYMAYGLMKADAIWNGKGSLKGFRKYWAVLTMKEIRRVFNRPKKVYGVTKLSLEELTEGGDETEFRFDDRVLQVCKDNYKREISSIAEKEELSSIEKILDNNANLFSHCKNPPLSKRQYTFLVLRFVDKMTLAEIGKKFNITRQAVEQYISKIIKILKRHELYREELLEAA